LPILPVVSALNLISTSAQPISGSLATANRPKACWWAGWDLGAFSKRESYKHPRD